MKYILFEKHIDLISNPIYPFEIIFENFWNLYNYVFHWCKNRNRWLNMIFKTFESNRSKPVHDRFMAYFWIGKFNKIAL